MKTWRVKKRGTHNDEGGPNEKRESVTFIVKTGCAMRGVHKEDRMCNERRPQGP